MGSGFLKFVRPTEEEGSGLVLLSNAIQVALVYDDAARVKLHFNSLHLAPTPKMYSS